MRLKVMYVWLHLMLACLVYEKHKDIKNNE